MIGRINIPMPHAFPMLFVSVKDCSTYRKQGFKNNMFIKRIYKNWQNFTTRSVSPQSIPGKRKSRFVTEISTQNLHATLGPILVTAQCFGLLPVHGVLASSPRALHYQPRSFRTLYAHALLVSIALLALLSTIHMARELRSKTFTVLGGLGAATAGAVFYGNALCATWLFLRLAPRWGALMRRWTDVEFRLDLGSGGNNTTRSPFLLTSAVLCFATAEHALSIAINLRSASNNNNNSNSTHGWLQTYATSSHNFIFTLVEYSTFRGIFILIFSHIATFTWNFMDLFIMLMSEALTRRFRQFNTILIENEGKLVSRGWWREAREQYASLASLTRTLDHCIAGITLLSFSNNLYFVCLQLLNSLAPTSSEPSTVETAYFWGSFSFLVGRMGAVTLLASNVHHSSREALPALFACPSVAFCEEVARLQQHMCGDELALSGLGLFHVTRSFMLAVAGAVATYEVVLLQFSVAVSSTCSCASATLSSANMTGE